MPSLNCIGCTDVVYEDCVEYWLQNHAYVHAIYSFLLVKHMGIANEIVLDMYSHWKIEKGTNKNGAYTSSLVDLHRHELLGYEVPLSDHSHNELPTCKDHQILTGTTSFWILAVTGQKKNNIHQLITMLSTSKNVLFPGHNHLLTTGANEPSL